ncbi:DUF3618 domain-containing protein [Georgenia sp. TF02-10]|uniref:DUF3618 domain-containing protein n=1 Tax=Georgenia sp. TF02-10 TaxID=2917725 RepID=UPI001FA73675|nr:DUF3618 domain-containing protein [Georgenia sp. TF02-10]UNX54549.1 DUF3618 domain-containing protein [Georgenia sp. TF02-10]
MSHAMEQQPGSRTPEEIEADLARTRLELTSTVDELTDRLDPRAKVEEVKGRVDAVKEAATQQAATFVGAVRERDPKALATVGVGVLVTVGLTILRWRRSR